jgi:2',3'-cyclic-nucleotide 2'-phosphodiesterase (5'-nucleotidase family)
MKAAVILHTADLHNRLSAAAAGRLKELKQARPGALLLDSGDAVSAGNLSFRMQGEPILKLMAETGYDAMAMGNRESHPSCLALGAKLRDADFPVLAANLVARHGRLPAAVRRHMVFHACDLRVAVMGIAPQMTSPASVWARVTDCVFEDPVESAAGLAPRLKGEADLVICLSHCGLTTDRQIAAIPEVDLVLGGHSHRQAIERMPRRAVVVHAGCYGSHVSLTEIGSRDDVRCELQPLEEEA